MTANWLSRTAATSISATAAPPSTHTHIGIERNICETGGEAAGGTHACPFQYVSQPGMTGSGYQHGATPTLVRSSTAGGSSRRGRGTCLARAGVTAARRSVLAEHGVEATVRAEGPRQREVVPRLLLGARQLPTSGRAVTRLHLERPPRRARTRPHRPWTLGAPRFGLAVTPCVCGAHRRARKYPAGSCGFAAVDTASVRYSTQSSRAFSNRSASSLLSLELSSSPQPVIAPKGRGTTAAASKERRRSSC